MAPRVGAAVVHPRLLDAQRPDRRLQVAWREVAVAHDQAMSVRIGLVRVGLEVLIHLAFDGMLEHPARPFAKQLIEHGRGGDCQRRCQVQVARYSRHGRRTFLPAASRALVFFDESPRVRRLY